MSDLDRLRAAIAKHGPLAVAVSGGVDSLTLAHVAGGLGPIEVLHAVSPAVPGSATARVRAHAARAGWRLQVIEAGEFADPDYLRNPANRCYFCKTNLYARIRAATPATIAAGTNTDDLGEFRPGLGAAAEAGVVHPFVEAGISKRGVRAIAAGLGLGDIAELPAQPCLASRIETGIAIDASDLAFVHRVEEAVAARIGPGDIRCRVTARGVRLQLPEGAARAGLDALLAALCAEEGRVFAGIETYRRGSAFLTGAGAGRGA